MEEQAEEKKSNRPPDDDFRQQRLKAWQPIMTPFKVVAIFVAIGVAFIPTGTTLLYASNNIYESRIMYDGSDAVIDCDVGAAACPMTFTFSEDVDGPIHVYYELQNFYQNHRKYVNSRDAYQLGGQILKKTALESSCISDVTVEGNDNMLLNPCGLIANSFFNDTITLTGSSPAGRTMDESDIAWASDKDKFKQPEDFVSCEGSGATCASVCSGAGVTCTEYTDPVTSQVYQYYYPDEATTQYLYETYDALPTFRKLYGIIDGNFKKGNTLTFSVKPLFEVSSFDGSKSLLITNLGEFGGKNPYLGVAYIVVGSICLMFAALFFTKQLISPRAVADPSLLNWN